MIATHTEESTLAARPYRYLRALLLPTLALVMAALSAHAQQTMSKPMAGLEVTAGHDPSICAPDGIGVGGYDLVTYRLPGGPRMGSPEFLVEHDGLRYLFVDAAHRDKFLEDPAYYLPAYHGWCAVTLALGRLTCPDYTLFKIENDRLLLFEVTGFTNGRTLWDTDPPGFRQKADANFEVLNEAS